MKSACVGQTLAGQTENGLLPYSFDTLLEVLVPLGEYLVGLAAVGARVGRVGGVGGQEVVVSRVEGLETLKVYLRLALKVL